MGYTEVDGQPRRVCAAVEDNHSTFDAVNGQIGGAIEKQRLKKNYKNVAATQQLSAEWSEQARAKIRSREKEVAIAECFFGRL